MNKKLLKVKEERQFYKRLGYLLYTARRLRKRSQEETSKVLGLTRKTYALMERGESSIRLYDYITLSSYFKIHYNIMLQHLNLPIEFEKAIEDLIKAENDIVKYRKDKEFQDESITK